MNPTKIVQDLVNRKLSKEILKNFKFTLVSYDRYEMLDPTHKYGAAGGYEIMELDANEEDWDSWVYIHKYITNRDEAGYKNVLRFMGCDDHPQNIFIPIIDFATNAEIDNLDLSPLKDFGSILHVFNSGNSYHGVLDELMDYEQYRKWLLTLQSCVFVDQKWLEFSITNLRGNHSQVLRTTWTKKRPEPKYLKEIVL